MLRFRSRNPLVMGVALGSLLAGLATSPVAAANNVVVLAYYGDCGFSGTHAAASKTVKIEWRDSDGTLKSKHSVVATSSGSFVSRCELNEAIETGDVLTTTSGGATRSVTVPKVSATVRRDYDDVMGKVDPEPAHLIIEAITYEGGFSQATGLLHTAVPLRNNKDYWTDNTTWDDNPLVAGWDEMFVEWSNARGDTFVRHAYAEGALIWINRPYMQVAGTPRHTFEGHVERPLGTELAGFQGYVMESGLGTAYYYEADEDPIRIHTGDIIFGPFTYQLTVPGITASINKTTDRVVANCVNGGWGIQVTVHTRDLTKTQTRVGFVSGSGFTANFAASPAYNIASGDKVDVYCKVNSGDIFAKTFTVP